MRARYGLRPVRAVLLCCAAVIACSPVVAPASPSPSIGAVRPTLAPAGSPLPSPTPPALLPFALARSFPGVDELNGSPPDPSLSVGPDRILVTTNSEIALLAKDGRFIARTPLKSFFSGLTRTSRLTDPRSLFDRVSRRFFLVASESDEVKGCAAGSCINQVFIAVSVSESPLGFGADQWRRYAFDGTLEHGNPTASWGDFNMLATTDSMLLITERMDRVTTEPQNLYAKVTVFDKAALLRGDPLKVIADYEDLRDPASHRVVLDIVPAVALSSLDMFFLVASGPGSGAAGCGVSIWAIDPRGGEPVSRQAEGSFGECGGQPPATAPQQGGPLLDAASGRVGSPAVYRDGFIWVAQATAPTSGSAGTMGARILKIDVRAWPAAPRVVGSWELTERGATQFYPAIAVDSLGNAAIVIGRSGPEEFPSVRVTGHLASEGGSQLHAASIAHTSTGPLQTNREHLPAARFGDYFGAASDPTDETLWFIGEYAKGSDQWGTWIASLDLTHPDR